MSKQQVSKAHIIVLPYHGQGHINPMVQFCKRLAAKGAKITVATTVSNIKSMQSSSTTNITFESIYDDQAEGGIRGPGGFKGFLDRFEASGYKNVMQLYKRFQDSENPVKCLIHDATLPWASRLGKELGIARGAFLTQHIAYIATIYPMYCDLTGVPPLEPLFEIPGLPEIRLPDLPSLGPKTTRYSPIVELMLTQFDSFEGSDWVFSNTFHNVAEEAVRWMSRRWPVKEIGPTLPSAYLDKRIEGDDDYGFNIYDTNSDSCIKWLNSREKGSVIYVSFGSVANLNKEQSTEVAKALVNVGNSFLWVVKQSEEHTLPPNFKQETSNQGLVLNWCPQLAVLGHDAVGCFLSHCGLNSALEAVSLGVPVVAMPQFTDHIVSAHYVEHTLRVGIQPKANEDGLITSDELSRCIKEVTGGETVDEYRKNAARLKAMAKEAVDVGGSSDKHIDEVIAKLVEQH